MRYDDGTDYGTAILQAGHANATTYNSPPHRLADEYAAAEANDGDPASCSTPPPPPVDDEPSYDAPSVGDGDDQTGLPDIPGCAGEIRGNGRGDR